MNPKLCLWMALVLAAGPEAKPATAAEAASGIPPKLPIDDFSRFKIVGGLSLSPDGKTIAYELSQGSEWVLVFQDWETGKPELHRTGANGTTPVWINGERVVYGYGSSIERSGKNSHFGGLEGFRSGIIFARFPGDKSNEFLATYGGLENVVSVNARSGSFIDRVASPGNVIRWMADGSGFVRAAVQMDKGQSQSRVLVRADAESPWLIPAGLDFNKDRIRPHWLSADGKLLYLSQPTPDGTWGLYSYDLDKQQIKELILSHTTYDIFPSGAPTLAPKTRDILGFDYVTDKQRTIWFDPQMGAVQAALDQILPNRVNTVMSLSDDLQRMIILSTSARDRGTYYRFDLAKKELKPVLPILPWIKPAQMAESQPISYPSRDGLTIHGYLTLPAGRDPKHLPLIVYVHDRIWERDTWQFDLDVQFLANRGYAVLQVNFRGSAGYGQAFQEKAYRQLGNAVQNDITDGTRWAIAQGIADPARIAILGQEFGGYSALMGVIQNPQLYCCAIGTNCIYDWANKYRFGKEKADWYRDEVGDPVTDAAAIAAMSPVNRAADVGAPLLLVHDVAGGWYDEFRAFTKALDHAHKPYETMDKNVSGAEIVSRKGRVEYLTRIEAFLTKHMPSDMAGVAAPPAAK